MPPADRFGPWYWYNKPWCESFTILVIGNFYGWGMQQICCVSHLYSFFVDQNLPYIQVVGISYIMGCRGSTERVGSTIKIKKGLLRTLDIPKIWIADLEHKNDKFTFYSWFSEVLLSVILSIEATSCRNTAHSPKVPFRSSYWKIKALNFSWCWLSSRTCYIIIFI